LRILMVTHAGSARWIWRRNWVQMR
jgi:hypothetical protein